jgi:hypothetical protein
MNTVHLHRYSQDQNQSLSVTTVLDTLKRPRVAAVTLERGWRNNAPGVSCIPAGEYELRFEWSPKFKMKLWEIYGVPNGRSECKFHVSNFWYQLNGCIAPGREPKYIDRDRYLDVTASTSTLKAIHRSLAGQTRSKLFITTEPGIF